MRLFKRKAKQAEPAEKIYIHLVDSPKSFSSQEEKDSIFAEARHTHKTVELTVAELHQLVTWSRYGDRYAIVCAFQLGYCRGKAAAMKEDVTTSSC